MIVKGQELSDAWKRDQYKKGGEEYLRVGQSVTFTYFSRITHKIEFHTAKVIGKTYHAGYYLAEDADHKRWTIVLDSEGWRSPDNG